MTRAGVNPINFQTETLPRIRPAVFPFNRFVPTLASTCSPKGKEGNRREGQKGTAA